MNSVENYLEERKLRNALRYFCLELPPLSLFKLLTKFINDQGKITPRRVTGTSSKMHRKLVVAIKRARNIALLPFAAVDRD